MLWYFNLERVLKKQHNPALPGSNNKNHSSNFSPSSVSTYRCVGLLEICINDSYEVAGRGI